jgi:hypothetical protein
MIVPFSISIFSFYGVGAELDAHLDFSLFLKQLRPPQSADLTAHTLRWGSFWVWTGEHVRERLHKR